MGSFRKGAASYVGSGLWWLTDKLYGDEIYQAIRPMIPAALVHPVASDLVRWATAYGPPFGLFVLGTYFFLRNSKEPVPRSSVLIWLERRRRQVRTWITRVLPIHVITIGLLIVFAGVVWQYLRPTTAATSERTDVTTKPAAQTPAGVAPNTTLAANSTPSVGPIKPRYNEDEIRKMIGAMGTLRDLLDKAIAPKTWAAGDLSQSWEKTLREIGPAALATRLKEFEAPLIEAHNRINAILYDLRHYEDRIRPVVDGYEVVGAFQGASTALAAELREYATAQNVNVAKIVSGHFDKWKQANNALSQWVGQTGARITTETKVLREWTILAPTPPAPQIAILQSQVDSLTTQLNTERQSKTPPAELPTPAAPKRVYDAIEKTKLKGLLISISEILNTEGAEIVRNSQRYTNPMMAGEGTASSNYDSVKKLHEATMALHEKIFRKIIPENRYFERDLKSIVGDSDYDKNIPYQLAGRFGAYEGKLSLVLTMLPKMKDNADTSNERQLLGMIQQYHELNSAISSFIEWIAKCNERIDEKTRDLQ